MKLLLQSLSIWLASTLVANAQLEVLDTPQVLWEATAPAVEYGNGVFLTPDESLVLTTSVDGPVNAYEASSGNNVWLYTPPEVDGGVIRCHSGITFWGNNDGTYMVYSIIDNENGISPAT